jgi:hypothetical protein
MLTVFLEMEIKDVAVRGGSHTDTGCCDGHGCISLLLVQAITCNIQYPEGEENAKVRTLTPKHVSAFGFLMMCLP